MTADGSPAGSEGLEVSLDAKVAFMQRPDVYPDRTPTVESIETHMAWVFLTDRRAYKLKKPVHHAYLDFSTLEARRRDCLEEVRLNRPLAPDVYLGTLALARTDHTLEIGGHGTVVDWLVVMRRLPRERMLDHTLRHRSWTTRELDDVVRWLLDFYRSATRIELDAEVYRAGLQRDIRENRDELWSLPPLLEEDRPRVEAIGERLIGFVDTHAALFDERTADQRIVEGHGDLRPEHVYLGPPPAVIDCIEFNRAFRILDIADDLAFLRLECDRLGAPGAGERVFATYRSSSDDDVDEALVAFYMAHRALLRAKIALWHLKDHDVRKPDHWMDRTLEYLRLAEQHAQRADG